MLPAANQGLGSNVNFPDVCLTPAPPLPSPVPIPYPNAGMNTMSMPFAANVLMSAMPAHNMAAKPMMTNGDNAGVAHPLCMQPGGCIVGNPTVHINGLPAEHQLTPAYGNNFNAPAGAKLVPSLTNVFISWRAAPTDLSDIVASLCEDTLSRTVRGKIVANGVGVLRIERFTFGVPVRARREIERLARLGMRSLVIDLRANPGGSVAAAVGLAELFLPRGATATRLQFDDGTSAPGWNRLDSRADGTMR